MALDGVFLHHTVKELNEALKEARVSQIYQPNRDELTFVLRGYSGTQRLLISARANSPRVHLSRNIPENPSVPTMLCMLLRKRLSGAKLLEITQPQMERIAVFHFEAVNELGDKVRLKLFVEIMGKYSNVILCDEDLIIIDALKRVDLSMSSQRVVLPNLKYELPPPQDKLNILEQDIEKLIEKIEQTQGAISLNKALLHTLQGVSPIVCRELEYQTGGGKDLINNNLSTAEKLALFHALEKLKRMTEGCAGVPCMVMQGSDGKLLDFTFMEVRQYGEEAKLQRFNSFSELLDSFYAARDSRERMRIKSQSLHKLLGNLTERLARKINVQRTELEACKNREQLRISGDLLQANLYRIEKGASSVQVENFYDENNSMFEIRLNPAISPAANAQKYYKEYQKAKNGEKMLAGQIKKALEELDYIEAVQDSLSRAETEKDLAQIRMELEDQGYLKRPKGKQKNPAALPPLSFYTSDGFKVLVGRNNRQNDQLTLKTAQKNDIWFHTKEIPGSHTIIVSEGKPISETAVREAAQIAAYHSKAKNSQSVAVDYTAVKNVHKPNGAKPGMVIYSTNQTAYVTPQLPPEKAQELSE